MMNNGNSKKTEKKVFKKMNCGFSKIQWNELITT